MVVLSGRIVSLSVLGEAVMRELKRDAQFDNRQPYHPNDSWGLEGPLKHFWTVDLQVRLDVTRRLVKSLAALAIPDSLRRQRWVPASPGGQHADR